MQKKYPTFLINQLVLFTLFVYYQPVALGQRAMTPSKKESTSATNAGRIALVIGNSAYKERPLPNAQNDARAVRKALQDAGFKVLYHENLDKIQMEEALIEFTKQLNKYSVGLLYFAGHGFESTQKTSYLMSTEVRSGLTETLAKSKSLSLDDIIGSMSESNIASKILIIDACRNNPFRGWNRNGSNGLGAVNPAIGTIVFMAAAPGEYSDENPDGINGLFTQELLKAINEPNVELSKIIKTTTKAVSLKNSHQHPTVFGQILDDFYFIRDESKEIIDPVKLEITQGKEAFINKDFKQGFELLFKNKDAIQMDRDALFDLANMYETGSGVSKNVNEAMTYYKKGADRGNNAASLAFQRLTDDLIKNEIEQAKKAYSATDYTLAFQLLFKNSQSTLFDSGAQYYLGYMYATGRGIEKDEKLAAIWYRKAAEQGNIDGQNNLGVMYANGQGVEKDDKQAVMWYRKAAKQGDATAQNNLGVMYASGEGVEKDQKQAVVWYRKAAEQGDADAQFNLGAMYANGQGVKKDEKQAVMWYRKAAEQGLAIAQNNLGARYANGLGVEKDDKLAFMWYQKAAEQGFAKAQNNLGIMYDNGQGVEKDDKLEFMWYQKAAEQGLAIAQKNLGYMYASGEGIEKDEKQAEIWIRKAAEQGLAGAQNDLGLMYEYGIGVEKDEKLAVMWYRKAAEQGLDEAQNNLGSMYEYGQGVEKDEKIAVMWYRKAAEQGLDEAQNNLGVMYANGRGIEKDEKMAVIWYRKAAEQGLAKAQFKLGMMYANGQGVEKDEKIAVMWYRKAAEQGLDEAQNNLGVMYANGRGIEKDEKMAVIWYRKAAEQGLAKAQFKLGMMYANGLGVEKNEKIAVMWYTKAAEQGNTDAQKNLGARYANGLGVEKDEKIAVMWYTKAAEQGDAEAKKNLEYLYANGQGLDNNQPKENIELVNLEITQGKEAFINKDFNKAFQLLSKNKDATQMDGDALFDLANMYETGSGVSKTINEAIAYYKKAAGKGSNAANIAFQQLNDALITTKIKDEIAQAKKAYLASDYTLAFQLLFKNSQSTLFDLEAQYYLGYMYTNGLGVEKNEKLAVMWFRKAAEQRNAEAQKNLGFMYANGLGIEKDEKQAVIWYSEAAKQGNANGQFNLGVMYDNGRGVERDYKQAIIWYRKAAEQGYADGQNNLGVMYENGSGVKKDLNKAIEFYQKAARQDNTYAQQNLTRLNKTW